MPADSEKELKIQLECLRIASDLVQFASDTLSPELKEHCLRVAQLWTDRAEYPPEDDESGFVLLDC
jgi:hypothetical protein